MNIMDVTLRDGGFLNGFALSSEAAAAIFTILDNADLDGIEIGYLSGLPADHGDYPAAGICYAWQPEQIANLASQALTPVVAMLHPAGPELLRLNELAHSKLGLVRVAVTPEPDITWRPMTDSLREAGLSFTINLTLATWATTERVLNCAIAAETAGAEIFYVADTNSSFLPRQVEDLFRRVSDVIQLPLGFHAHDGKRLAHANVLASQRGGARWADSSLGGFGRGAGNALTEVLHEISKRAPEGRYALLRSLPYVADAFGVDCAERLWLQLGAFINIWPSTMKELELAALELGVNRYSLVADKVLGSTFVNPPNQRDLRRMVGLNPAARDDNQG
ncbi:MAG: 4-hydroxy 2-oxovalerate aldolase [Microbacteriaceae bacterium]|jgi:4-hydroxy 2-oxovalerate aldolase|nr:4-hydroxy 2-oxovalerate aldolase [Microbacteriaceae bacterium]